MDDFRERLVTLEASIAAILPTLATKEDLQRELVSVRAAIG